MGLLSMIQTVVSQQPGCVVEPSYVMKWSVSGSMLRNDRCFIGVAAPETTDKKLLFSQKLITDRLIMWSLKIRTGRSINLGRLIRSIGAGRHLEDIHFTGDKVRGGWGRKKKNYSGADNDGLDWNSCLHDSVWFMAGNALLDNLWSG